MLGKIENCSSASQISNESEAKQARAAFEANAKIGLDISFKFIPAIVGGGRGWVGSRSSNCMFLVFCRHWTHRSINSAGCGGNGAPVPFWDPLELGNSHHHSRKSWHGQHDERLGGMLSYVRSALQDSVWRTMSCPWLRALSRLQGGPSLVVRGLGPKGLRVGFLGNLLGGSTHWGGHDNPWSLDSARTTEDSHGRNLSASYSWTHLSWALSWL